MESLELRRKRWREYKRGVKDGTIVPKKGRPRGRPFCLDSDTTEASGPMATPCRIWKWASKPTDGGRYGHVNLTNHGRGYLGAHRLFYEQKHGPIADGMHIDHLCRVTLCVNPDHLEPVSYAENIRRGLAAKLTGQQAFVLREYFASCDRRGIRRPYTALVAAFGIDSSNIHRVGTGERWGDVTLARLSGRDLHARERRSVA